MRTTDSPAAARRRLRLALRDAREAAGLTQIAVAERLLWSVSKVNRIENGEVTISPGDLKELVGLLGISDPATVDEWVGYARVARQRGWWDDATLRPHLSPVLRQLIQYEAEATAIRHFQPTIIPGILQTPAYAKSVLDFWTDLPEPTRQARQTARAMRRERVFGGQDRPPVLAVLDESVVLRQVGGPAVMADQLESIVSLVRSGQLTVRIVPLIRGAIFGEVGGFTIIDLDDGAVLYREMSLDDVIRDERDTVDRYRRMLDEVLSLSLSDHDSARLIEGHAVLAKAAIASHPPNI